MQTTCGTHMRRREAPHTWPYKDEAIDAHKGWGMHKQTGNIKTTKLDRMQKTKRQNTAEHKQKEKTIEGTPET